MTRTISLVLLFSLAACGEAPVASSAAPFLLARPNVVIEADPPPPFTYWAPEGATIRNHPNVPGLWNAFVGGNNVATYFGDECHASEFQRFVGAPVQSFPGPPAGVELRTSCETCPVTDDLRPNRMNVIFNEFTQEITRIACY